MENDFINEFLHKHLKDLFIDDFNDLIEKEKIKDGNFLFFNFFIKFFKKLNIEQI
jgi:hypothetical protein